MIILLEGADCSGKTTLAGHFMEQANVTYFHNGPKDNTPAHYLAQLNHSMGISQNGGIVVIDRAWLSEQVYGHICRDGSNDPEGQCLKVFHRLVSATIMCVRSDTNRHLQHFNQVAKTRDEHAPDKAREIIKTYHELWYGSMSSQLPGVLKTISEQFPLSYLRGYYQYDMDTMDPHDFVRKILE